MTEEQGGAELKLVIIDLLFIYFDDIQPPPAITAAFVQI